MAAAASGTPENRRESAPAATRARLDDIALAARHARSQRGFFRALAGGSPGARLISSEALKGVQATAVPVRPWFSIFNSVVYENCSELEAALPTLERDYAKAAIKAWSVWVPPEDQSAPSLLEQASFVCQARPLRMASELDDLDLEPRSQLDPVAEPTWDMVARCNDRAYGVLEQWTMAAVVESMDDPASHLRVAQANGEVIAALLAREDDGDCYLWFVATVPEAQRRGVAAELVRGALRAARTRGCRTTSLESTPSGEALYAQLGYRALGRFQRWESSTPSP